MVLNKHEGYDSHTANKIVCSSGYCEEFVCFDWKKVDLSVVDGADLVQCPFAATWASWKAVQA